MSKKRTRKSQAFRAWKKARNKRKKASRKKPTRRRITARHRCKATTVKGRRCRNSIVSGGKCHIHSRQGKRRRMKQVRKRRAQQVSYLVNASFKPTKKQDRQAFHDKIHRAAKKGSLGHGCHLQTGRCDIDFEYKTRDAAERCKARLSRLKGVTARISTMS